MKRLLSIVLAFLVVLGMLPLFTTPTEAATTLSLAQLKEKFPDGKYYNHYVNNAKESANYQRDYGLEDFADSVTSQPCAKHSGSDYDSFVYKYDCNVFNGGMQCYAFAHRLAYLAYGTRACSWSKKYTASSVKPGDVIHYKGDGASASSGHWVFVIAVAGTTVTVGECNWGGNCIIRWGRSFNLSNVTSFTIYSAPYELSNGETDVTYEVDDRYPTPFEANTLLWWNTSNGKTPVYDAVNGNHSGNIYNGYNNEDDDCVIEEVYTNGWCKITVPGISGYRYCQLSVFVNILEGYGVWPATVHTWAQAYRRWDHGSPTEEYVDVGDYVYVVSQTDSMYQVIFSTSDGYFCRWVDRNAFGCVYTSVVTAPSCTTQGYTTHTCMVCGSSYVDSYVSAVGHNYGSWTKTKTATCTEKGVERRDCNRCDHYETREIAAKGHSYQSVVTAPTCTEQGYTTHTCANCGNEYVDSHVEALDHSYGAWYTTTEATCTEDGEERHDCTRCNHYETRKTDPAGHSLTRHEAKAATCTEHGWEAYDTCSKCDYSTYKQIDALGHDYVGGVCGNCGNVLGTVTTGNWTMSLDSVIYLNYYPTLTGFGEGFDFASCGGYILWTGEAAPSSRHVMYPGAENCVDVSGGWYQNEEGQWYVRTHDIFAKNLGDMVYIRPYVIVNGEYVYGACWYYSPAWYCYDILSNMEQDEDTRNVCAALLAYGAAAQVYFEHNTDELVTDIPAAADRAKKEALDRWATIDLSRYDLSYNEDYIDALPTTSNVDQHIKDLAGTLSGTRDYSIKHEPDTLDLQGAIRLTVRYSMEKVSIDWSNVASAKVLFWNEDAMADLDSLTVENANYIGELVYDEAEGIYKAQSDHILAKNLGDVVYFSIRIEMNDGTVYRGGLNWYSPEAFVADSIAAESGAIEVCKAIAVYSEMARIRFTENKN